jgi:hypothetical protein
MYKSIEIRWFFSKIDEDIYEYFKKNNLYFKDKWLRTDFYLDTGVNNISFKIREGKTELKILGKSSILKVSEKTQGNMEQWTKWSPELKKGLNSIEKIFEKPEKFIPVQKERLLLKFKMQKNEYVREENAAVEVTEGFQCEFVQLQLKGTQLYSFAIEAFGSEKQLQHNFNEGLKKIWSQIPTTELEVNHSYSYPELLIRK